jgi:hypothetical protein
MPSRWTTALKPSKTTRGLYPERLVRLEQLEEIPSVIQMEHKTVEKLESKIEKAVLVAIADMGLKRLPLLPSQQTMRLMAKAAVAVYEAAVEIIDGRPSERPAEG